MTRAPACRVSYCCAARDLEITCSIPGGSTTALVGPNGSGKSSTVDVVSGLLRPPGAEVVIGGRSVDRLPAHRRRVVHLLQRPLLFPRMDVLRNTAFGLRATGVRRREALRIARARLEEVGAGELAARRPDQLSGGQAQRVAIARALAPDPDVLLLDEPLSALDEDSRETIQALLAEVLADRTAVLITHSPEQVRALADRLVVLEAGRAVQQGAWEDVACAPASRFARRFTGPSTR